MVHMHYVIKTPQSATVFLTCLATFFGIISCNSGSCLSLSWGEGVWGLGLFEYVSGYFSCACHRLLTLVILLPSEPNSVTLQSLSDLWFYYSAGPTAPIVLAVAHKDQM